MANVKVSEFLKSATAKLADGDMLFAHVRSEGFLPALEGSTSLAQGQLIFKVQTVDGKKSILPAFIDYTDNSLKFKEKEPVVYNDGTKIVFHVGQNREGRQPYNGAGFAEYKDILPADVDKQMVLAFLDFADTTLSLGVNDFRIAEATAEVATTRKADAPKEEIKK